MINNALLVYLWTGVPIAAISLWASWDLINKPSSRGAFWDIWTSVAIAFICWVAWPVSVIAYVFGFVQGIVSGLRNRRLK